MSRFFWTIVLLLLLLANALLFGVQKGWLGQVWSEGREPERIKKELATERFKLVAPIIQAESKPDNTATTTTTTPSEAVVTPEAPSSNNAPSEKDHHSTDNKPAETPVAADHPENTNKPESTPAPASANVPASIVPPLPPTSATTAVNTATPPTPPSKPANLCLQTTTLSVEDSNALKAAIKSLNLKTDSHDASEPTSWIVHIPSQRSQQDVDARVEELKKAGVKDYFVMQDGGPMRMAISLGVFKVEESARSFQQGLVKQGVTQATLTPRMVNKVQLKFSEVNEADAAKLREAFKTAVHSAGPGKPNPELKDCGTTTASKP